MSTITTLTQKAIKAAKEQNWQEAIENNSAILELNPTDVDALNRNGLAYIQKKDIKKAKKTFQSVLEIDKANSLAKKHLQRIKDNQVQSIPTFSRQMFIEEPGKTKTVELTRLGEKEVLTDASVGQNCELLPKKRFISVTVNGNYLGALPEDISFRISTLLRSGNTYSCYIRSISSKHVTVFLKEEYCAETNKNIHSFPPGKGIVSPLSDIEENILFEENIPVEIVDTDADSERSFDDFDNDIDEDDDEN